MTASEGEQRPIKPVYLSRTLTVEAGRPLPASAASGEPPSHSAASTVKEYRDGRP